MLRHQIKAAVRLSDGERKTLAEIGRSSQAGLKDVATIVKPDTILGCTGSSWPRSLTALSSVRLPSPHDRPGSRGLGGAHAQENVPGYDRIVGALVNLGYTSVTRPWQHPETPWYPTSARAQDATTWKEFIRTHLDVLVATDSSRCGWTLVGW